MTAQIGTDGLDLPGDPSQELPSRDLLKNVTRVEPEPKRDWVDLAKHRGFRSTQRLRIRYLADGRVEVATYPAELAEQARYLYGGGLGSALVDAARERGWKVEPSPHIGFWNSSADRRLYMLPSIEPLKYVACWEDEDALRRVRYAREDVKPELWRWLKQKRFADDGDDPVLQLFLDKYLGNREADMRPGLRFRRFWPPDALAKTICNDFDAVFAVAGEPALGSAGLISGT